MGIQDNITEVYFERVFNLGNYETCRIGLKAIVNPANPDHSVEKTLLALDKATVKYRDSQFPIVPGGLGGKKK